MTTIYFHAPDVNHPAGGIRVVYRMADACNAAGLHAAVMHQRRGFRATWFSSDSPVVAAQEIRVADDDVLVVSELDASRMLRRAPGVTNVILNQNPYWTFMGGPVDYRSPDVAAVMSVSENGVRYLRYAFPGLEVQRIRLGVNTDLFRMAGVERRRTILYPASKGIGTRNQLLAILEQRGSLAGWEIRPVGGLDQAQLATVLAESAVLAATSDFEGFQMLLTEALASGVAVVGFDAGGGREFLTEDVAWPVPAGDVVRFVERLELVMRAWDEDRRSVEERTGRGATLVRETYTLEHEAADTVSALRPAVEAAQRRSGGMTHDVAEVATRASIAAKRLRVIARAALRG